MYVVTGGCGFIGSNLCAELVRHRPGARILVIDDLRSGSHASLVAAFAHAGIGPFRGEVVARSVGEVDWPAITGERPAAVFHLAAITDTTVADERAMIRDNAETFPPIVDACVSRGIPLAYASSAATYGTPPSAGLRQPFPLHEAGSPSNVYGFSKWLMECHHRRVQASRPGAWLVGLRYFNVFGPGEERKGKMASMVRQVALQMLGGGRPRLFADGTQARDQVAVSDVVRATMAAAGLGDGGRRPSPGVYNVGSGRATSFNDLVEGVRRGLGLTEASRPTEFFEMPPDVRRFYQDYTCADLAESRSGLGWSPQEDPLRAIQAYAEALAAGFRGTR